MIFFEVAMRKFMCIVTVLLLTGCNLSSPSVNMKKNISEDDLESFFRSKTISGNYAAAIKIRFTRPLPGVAYIGTIHGYPNNFAVCEELIEPYNADPTLTVIPGSTYFCEELR